jgi:general secretion pathway protein E
MTGHLVLSSIHANDAVSVLFRLIDLGAEAYLVSTTLVGIVAQRMIRRTCTHCRAPYQPSVEEQIAYEEEMKQLPTNFYRGVGCNLCANTGYRGRTGLFELMIMSEGVRRMLLGNASASDIRLQALKEGMVTMKHDGMMKVKEGITSVSEVLRSVFSIGL